MRFQNLGLVDYREALARQEETVQRLANETSGEEVVYLLEHPHVYTGGRRALEENLLAQKDFQGRPIDVITTNRGGDLTYHGPGQLVGYPHLDLRRRGRDVHVYLRNLEEALIQTAAAFGIDAFRRDGFTGVWTEQGKLASIGVGVRKWITMHGFALNVAPDMRYFELINPCGIAGCQMVSLEQLCRGASPTLDEVSQALEDVFSRVFAVSTPPALLR